MEELTSMLRNLQNKFDEQTKELRDMKQSIPQIINNNIDNKFANLEFKYNSLEKTITQQGRRIQQLERTTRQKNLIVFGIEENERSYYDLQERIVRIINQYMEINCNKENIAEVRRLGKKQDDGKIRPTIVSLTTMGMKIDLLKNKKKLNDSPYYIKEDFPPEILEERKKLTTQMLEERKNGRIAFLKYNKLVVIPEDKHNHQYHKKPSSGSNKRQLSESPENIEGNSSSGKNSTKKPFKRQHSHIHQYMIRNQNRDLLLDPLPSSSSSIVVGNAATPLQSTNKNKY